MKIKEMETEKLISLLCGDQFMNTKALPEYDILSLEMSDGPMGLRYQKKDKDSLGINRSEPATCLPAGVAVAASWNPDVAEQVGTIIGSEAAAYGVDLVLGPAVNLERNPLCGRNVEYLSEDPLLAGRLGGAYIRGVQSQQVGACIKHFAANNQETEREYLNVICEEDVLRDLYLKAFEIAIREGKPAAVMTSLSKINGTYCAENRWLFDILRNMRDDGCSIIIITHKLQEVLALSDRVAILRKGQYIDTVETAQANVQSLSEMMVGAKVDLNIERPKPENVKPRLIIDGINCKDKENVKTLDDVDLTVNTGEILGIAGISGSGQKELLEAIAGLQNVESGSIRLLDDNGGEMELSGMDSISINEAGISLAFVPEDRIGMGLVGDMDMTDNMMIRSYRNGKGPFLDRKGPRALAEKIKDQLEVMTPSISAPVRQMSGGNVQKVLVGREIAQNPKVLLVAFPTRGVDINTSHVIYQLLNEQKKKGVAVVCVIEDLDVVLELCDRIAVLCGGKISGVVDGRTATKEGIGLLMTKHEKGGVVNE